METKKVVCDMPKLGEGVSKALYEIENIFVDISSEESEVINKKIELSNVTGLRIDEIESILDKNNWSIDEACLNIDQYMQSLNGKIVASKVVIDGINNAGIYSKLAENLSSYNTMRGGEDGFKGFVFEEMHAANASANGTITEVLANNGPSDFLIKNLDGTYSYGQAKVGYNTSKIDWSAYKGQDIVIDKGNKKLIESAQNAGMNVIESDISNAEAAKLAKTMQMESRITGNPRAVMTSNIHACHQAGIKSAKSGAAFGAGFSLGSNIVEVASGDKELGEAAVDVAVDTAVSAVGSYVVGAGATALANTAVGGAVISGATAAGTAIAGTTAGAAVISAGATVAVAASEAAAVVGGAIASTTVGAAVTGGVAAATTALGATAVGAAAVAAAPLVVGGAVIGGLVALGRSLFD